FISSLSLFLNRRHLKNDRTTDVMRKIKSRTWKKQRYFRLQEDCMTIWYKSKKAGNAHSTFSVGDVEAVREGHQSEVLLSIADEFPPDRCFTLVFRGRRGNLDLVAESAGEAQSWIKGIRKLIDNLENMGQREKLDQWICDWFKRADKNRDGQMNFKEVRNLLKMMNVDMNEHHALRLFTMADKSQSGTLEDDEFVLFYKMLTQREDVLRVFQEYSGDGQKLTLQDLKDFLREEQLHEDGVQQYALKLIERYEPSDTAKMLQAMTFDGFLMYLNSSEGSISNPTMVDLYRDMTQPLCNYFISSSHNTYLLEDQIRGHSSVEGYIRALKRGCRCVEVDCWDGPNGEPIVYHGHTFTSKIFFKDVVTVLGNYAFKASQYPVILSIENHCSIEQQKVMAQHLTQILGDKLLKSPLDGKIPIGLPSPEDLKGKILLKGKKIGGLENSMNGVVDDPLMGEVSDEEETQDLLLLNTNGGKYISLLSVAFSSLLSSPLLSSRLVSSRLVSSRLLSSPLLSSVALNFQTAGVEMDLNDGLFSQNGHCGYVLKPTFMCNTDERFDPENPQNRDGYKPLSLSVQVISGQQLPKVNIKEGSIIDPLVRVEIHGIPLDQAKQETRYIDNNGFNPVWYDTLQFTIHVPELALVRFVVEDYDKTSKNDFVGQFTLPFTCIQPGYRHIHLLSKDGNLKNNVFFEH
uniref:Phosphoinositide phospholipase C n=1 Tax=Sinocyclocheilus anshuiensis TaxID=1608454 RepID=A0A671SDP3_9TELE